MHVPDLVYGELCWEEEAFGDRSVDVRKGRLAIWGEGRCRWERRQWVCRRSRGSLLACIARDLRSDYASSSHLKRFMMIYLMVLNSGSSSPEEHRASFVKYARENTKGEMKRERRREREQGWREDDQGDGVLDRGICADQVLCPKVRETSLPTNCRPSSVRRSYQSRYPVSNQTRASGSNCTVTYSMARLLFSARVGTEKEVQTPICISVPR